MRRSVAHYAHDARDECVAATTPSNLIQHRTYGPPRRGIVKALTTLHQDISSRAASAAFTTSLPVNNATTGSAIGATTGAAQRRGGEWTGSDAGGAGDAARRAAQATRAAWAWLRLAPPLPDRARPGPPPLTVKESEAHIRDAFSAATRASQQREQRAFAAATHSFLNAYQE